MDIITIENPELKERLIQKIKANKFSPFIGIEYLNVKEGKVSLKLELKEHHQQQNGYAHGGLLSTLCDVAAGFAAYTMIPVDQQVVTGEIKVSYFRAGKGKTLFTDGYVVKRGRRVMFCEALVYYFDDNEKKVEVVKASTSMIVIGESF